MRRFNLFAAVHGIGFFSPHPLEKIISQFRERIKNPIKAQKAVTGPCKENIFIGDEVDLLKFPVPYGR